MVRPFLTALALAALVAPPWAQARQAGTPYLYIRLVTAHGTQTPPPGRPSLVPNNERIQFQVCVEARTVEERLEQPEIQALNQHPEYFKHRPPPNVSLSVRRITAAGRQEVPFRVNSSGGGKDLTVYSVNADIDLLEDKAARLRKAEQFVEWMAARLPGDPRSHLLQSAPGRQQLAGYFEEQYVNNPPGDYEIIARYTPTTAENWRGALVSAPFLIKVIDNGDFFDVLRTRLGPGAPAGG